MKTFCISPEHAANVINFEKKKVTINKNGVKPHEDLTIYYICR